MPDTMPDSDVLLFLGPHGHRGCDRERLGEELRAMTGVTTIKEKPLARGRILHVFFRPDQRRARDFVQLAERVGCQARLIGL